MLRKEDGFVSPFQQLIQLAHHLLKSLGVMLFRDAPTQQSHSFCFRRGHGNGSVAKGAERFGPLSHALMFGRLKFCLKLADG